MNKSLVLRFTLSVVVAFGFMGLTQAQAAASWPASSSATVFASAGSNLPASYEPSGAAWDGSTYLYTVSDEGILSRLTTSGVATNWPTTGDYNMDFEGVTVTGTNSYVYIANEDNNAIYEFNPAQGAMTGKTWSFLNATWTTAQKMINFDNNLGLEGIAYIPADDWSYSYGVFLGLQQSTGIIFIGRPDLSSTTGAMTYVDQITPVAGRGHPSDLFYSFPEKKLYILYDDGYLRVLQSTNTNQYTEYVLPGTAQQEEGFALQTNSQSSSVNAYIASDNTGQILKYSLFPQTYPVVVPTVIDADGDGVASTLDCNDADSSVSTNQTYYRDADGDGFGLLASSTSLCSLTAPTGYVTNSSDLNDADYDNDGVSTTSDCNDANSSISALQTYYQDGDGDGLGSGTTSILCSYTAPTGYVSNSNDVNDTDFDNDGVSTAVDCDDHNSTVSTSSTFYQDLDGDGLGSSVTTTSCATTAPAGYVTNSNESRDANDLIPNAGIEIADDLRDNDGDGEVDEYNYLATNGLHPYYSTLDPANYLLATTSIINLGGATNGNIKVRLADDSVYRYKIFLVTTNKLTKVRFYNSTGYLLVTSSTGKKVVVNGYTGAIVRTISVKK